MLSVIGLHRINDWIINECGAAGGIKIGKRN
jgi:hypothetical protein